MPELPDIMIYIEALQRQCTGHPIEKVLLKSVFLVRSLEPDLFAVQGRRVLGFRRLGKRVVWELEDELFLVFHLMISGRFHLRKPGTKPTRKTDLLALQFADFTVMLTEVGSKRRASLFVVSGEDRLADHSPKGLEVLDAPIEDFTQALSSENRTLKRALCNPSMFSGIGNAYSDEILHAARLSPFKWTSRLSAEEVERLYGLANDKPRSCPQ